MSEDGHDRDGGLLTGDPGTAFQGTLGRTFADSTPWWPLPAAARDGSPNIVVFLVDDLGFADFGCFGAEIETPNIDRLAAGGVRFSNYTTVPMCSPARAALLTGKNPHSVGCGWITHADPGYPGYGGEISPDAPTFAELMGDNGYSTMAIGKWHNTKEHNACAAGDKRSWPVQRGFERFYGFIASETSFFHPDCLYEGSQTVDIDTYPEEYFATDDWTNRAIRWTKEHLGAGPSKPFLLYLAFNAPHAPIQAKSGDIEKYRGRYDAGWDVLREQRWKKQLATGIIADDTKLPPRNPGIPAWHDLPEEKRALFARHMEVYAALIDNLDQNIGRYLDFLEKANALDNTLIILTSDNGASAGGGDNGTVNGWNARLGGDDSESKLKELLDSGRFGGPETYATYPRGWAQVCNTPFRYFKRTPVNGGIRVPFIAHWPVAIKARGAIQQQWIHVTDVLPTLLEAAGIQYPNRFRGYRTRALDGISFFDSLLDSDAPGKRTRQHYELDGNRGYIKDGWKIVSLQPPSKKINLENWMLFNLRDDPTEIEDLATRFPEKLNEMMSSFDEEAFRNYVYPIDNRGYEKSLTAPPHRQTIIDTPHVFYAGAQTIERGSVFQLFNDRSYRITARFSFRTGDAGVIFSIGSIFGGLLLYVMDDALVFIYQRWPTPLELPGLGLSAGVQEVVLDYRAIGKRQGAGRLFLNGAEVVTETAMSPTMVRMPSEGIDIGIDRRQPASKNYASFGAFRYSNDIAFVRMEPGAQAPGTISNLSEVQAQRLAVD
jgi:arylsulfatase A-like enzyme